MSGSYTAPTDKKFDDGLKGLNPHVHKNSAFDIVRTPPVLAALFVDALAVVGVAVAPRSPIVAATAITQFRFDIFLLWSTWGGDVCFHELAVVTASAL
jgi:hypothetical protein